MTLPPTYRTYLPAAVIELNLGDEWRARWVDAATLPVGTPVDYVYSLVFMGEHGYVTRRVGSEAWGTVEGRPDSAETPAAFLKRAAKEQTGATPGTVELVGFLECRATSHNRECESGTVRLRPIYVLIAKQVKDLGRTSLHERRRLPLNQHIAALRKRCPELETHISRAAGAYAIIRSRQDVIGE